MHQLTLLKQTEHIVNVASVPQRSPFRYPGGKTWLVPRIREWLDSLPSQPHEFIEPFAGGGIISLTVAFEELANHVTMVEKDDQVAAVWKAIFSDDGEWLANEIVSFDLTVEGVESELETSGENVREKAFKTILKNRVNRGGILAPGAGRIKTGENNKGLKSRWYPETLKRRILDIASVRERITFIEGDGMGVVANAAKQEDTVFFFDPPYTAAGKKAGSRLYAHFDFDHEELFRVAESLSGDFLMTYDETEEIRAMAKRHGFDIRNIAMKSTHHAKMTELLIGKDLSWLCGKGLSG